MLKSNYFIRWFPAMLVISFILMILTTWTPPISNGIIEQVLQYVSLGLIAYFILTAYRKEQILVVPRRNFWLIALGSLVLSYIGSIFETLRFVYSDFPIPSIYSLILFSISHYVFLYAIFYRIITKRTLGQHVLAFV
ncbi:MAG TPA: GGDEF domain-containing protein, partial [Exiguobacterium sp.]|nr:GGDEF domain-containing protein [Exiguobacterium sp.]